MKKTIVLLATMFLFAVSAFAQTSAPKADEPKKDDTSPLIGAWEITIAAPGQDLPGTLKLEKDADANYKGSVITDMGDAAMKNIKIADDGFTADITANVQGETLEGTVTGKLKDGKLTGEINLPGLGAIPYTGKKR